MYVHVCTCVNCVCWKSRDGKPCGNSIWGEITGVQIGN